MDPALWTRVSAFAALATLVALSLAPVAEGDHVPALYDADHLCARSEGRHVLVQCSVEEALYRNLTVPEPVPAGRGARAQADSAGVLAQVEAAPVSLTERVDARRVTVGPVTPWDLLLGFHHETAPWTDPMLTDAEREEVRAKSFVLDFAESTGVHVRLLCGWDLTQTERVCAFYNPEADAETALVRAHRDALVADGLAATARSLSGVARENAPAASAHVTVERVAAGVATAHAGAASRHEGALTPGNAVLTAFPDLVIPESARLQRDRAPTSPVARDAARPGGDEPGGTTSPDPRAGPRASVQNARASTAPAALGDVLVAVGAAAGAGVLVTLLAVLAHRHLTRRNVLGNGTREAVYALVQARAGVTIMDVAREVGVRHTTATYHLGVLEELGMVRSERVGNRKHWFPAASHRSRDDRLARVLPDMGRAQAVWDALVAKGRARAADLADACGMTPSGVLWHLKRLEGLGIVTAQAGPRGREFEPTSPVKRARNLE